MCLYKQNYRSHKAMILLLNLNRSPSCMPFLLKKLYNHIGISNAIVVLFTTFIVYSSVLLTIYSMLKLSRPSLV